MTRDEQRAAIAELCGVSGEAPDYLSDIDAIMDAIDALPEAEQKAVAEIVNARLGLDYPYATPAHMAEAFLMVKGKLAKPETDTSQLLAATQALLPVLTKIEEHLSVLRFKQ